MEEVVLASISLGLGFFAMKIIDYTKEKFEETYFDSEQYYKRAINNSDNNKINKFNPSQQPQYNNNMPGYEKDTLYPSNHLPTDTQNPKWIEDNSLYSTNNINGIPLKDYYDNYTKKVLSDGSWFLNKDMPEETKQYRSDSAVQLRMEQMTGLQQERDRNTLGIPTKSESLNLFTPSEKTTGYGYQYGQSGSGPGLSITRQKEFEDLKKTIKFKTNEQPIEKIHVGRGLAIGTEVPAAGGFQQYTRIVPENISDYKSNQLPGMVTGEKWAFSNAPTSQQPVVSNRPQKFYSLCQHGPVTGKSVMTAPMTIPDYTVNLKNQNRSFINYGYGVPLTNLDSFLNN